jgi:UDP-N-acetylmuramate: L-alanyl-gamma-D-glutamyl-meso-diaminopimelate ligase
MGALAGLLRAAGHDVRGSDQNVYPPMSDFLASEGIPVLAGFRAENLDWGPERVVVGNACRKDHVEVVAAKERGFALTSFPQTLSDLFLAKHHPLVVAGTHGKTTTSSLLAWLLVSAGRDASMLVGGIAQNFGSSFRLGRGEDFVVEGDEYDTAFFDKGPKFLHYQPRTLVVTGIEYDHADIYPDVESIVRQFEKLVALVPADGRVLLCADDARANALAPRSGGRVWRYGFAEGADVRASNVVLDTRGASFDLWIEGESLGRFDSPLPGRHNVQNAVAALAAAVARGAFPDALRAGLASFRSVRRRQEIVGVEGGVTVIDDFAHHPTAVRETIGAVRTRFPEGRVLALFEPRTNTSRRSIFQEEYALAFDGAACAFIAPPFGADKLAPEARFDSAMLARALTARGIPAESPPDIDALVRAAVKTARPGDALLCMSNGAFGGVHGKLLAALGERERER